MEKKAIKYFIWDSRYLIDENSSTIFEVCDTLEEAKENAPSYGDGNVIVKTIVQGRKILKETPLTL